MTPALHKCPFCDRLHSHPETSASSDKVLEELEQNIQRCLKSCPSDARQKPKTMLNYFLKTIKQFRQQTKEREQG